MKIANRTFIISGGSSGLGLATAIVLLSHGANISILDLNPPAKDDSSTALHDPNRTLFTRTDVSSTSSLQAALSSTISWITEQTKAPLAGVICCAGIGFAARALPKSSTMSIDDFDRVIAINLRGTVDLIRLALPHLALNTPWGPDGERGVIIVVSSVAAYEGQVGQLAYAASKGAVRSLVLPLAREVGQSAGVRVMGVAPGAFETGMTRRPRPVRKERGSEGAGKKSGKPVEKVDVGKPNTEEGTQKFARNREMFNYPMRMGRADEFASLVKEMIENPMLNGEVVRLDGGIRLPSRL